MQSCNHVHAVNLSPLGLDPCLNVYVWRTDNQSIKQALVLEMRCKIHLVRFKASWWTLS